MTTIESTPEAVAVAPSDHDADTSSMLESVSSASSPPPTTRSPAGSTSAAASLGLLTTVVINVLIGVERLDGADTVLDVEVLPQLIDAQRVGLVFATLLPLAMAAASRRAAAARRPIDRVPPPGLHRLLDVVRRRDPHHVALVNNGGTLGGDADAVGLFIAGIGLMAIGLTATAGSVATTILTTRAPA
jgi:hypothetical protein